MTAAPFNHARASIEATLHSAEYGAQMMDRSAQDARDSNQDAAYAALSIAWRAHDAARACVDLLPILSPEHAALIDQAERQDLVNRLNGAADHIVDLMVQHRITKQAIAGYNDAISNWYTFCFETGHYLHMAQQMFQLYQHQIVTEEDTRSVTFAVTLACENARKCLDLANQNEPPTHAPFPQTRQAVKQQATDNCAAIQLLVHDLEQRTTAAKADNDNSPGYCRICGTLLRADDFQSHTTNCFTNAVRNRYPEGGPDERQSLSQPLVIWVRSEHLRHWMMIVVQPATTLRQLDKFLRDVWLECCGHMSHFEIGDVQYSSHVPGPGDHPFFDVQLAEFDEQHMIHTVEEAVRAGQRFHHEFDYGDTTCLDLEYIATLPAQYDHLRECVKQPDEAQPQHDDFITIVARNLPPERCFTCDAVAHWRYRDNPYTHGRSEQDRPIAAPPYFCPSCAPHETPTVPLRNSPRAGVGCYDNVHQHAG